MSGRDLNQQADARTRCDHHRQWDDATLGWRCVRCPERRSGEVPEMTYPENPRVSLTGFREPHCGSSIGNAGRALLQRRY